MKFTKVQIVIIESCIKDAVSQICNEVQEQMSLYGANEVPEPLVENITVEMLKRLQEEL